jgi:N-acetylglucosaminyldiphosphoundecaprenol N-acetyl-beta-D-mannosaminyltransferase
VSPDGRPSPGKSWSAVSLFDIEIADVTMGEAATILQGHCEERAGRSRSVYFVNAHTLNLAQRDEDFTRVLQAADTVFGDGSGVRLAARWLRGIRLKDNVNGTDLLPTFLRAAPPVRQTYYLLGAAPGVIERSAEAARRMFPSWEMVGHHHGFFDANEEKEIVRSISDLNPNLVLVGMGNPRQEIWIHRNLPRLRAGCCVGIGALLDYWAGEEIRSPVWMQRIGFEWFYRMLFQKGKFERYAVGVPVFLWSVLRSPRTPHRQTRAS